MHIERIWLLWGANQATVERQPHSVCFKEVKWFELSCKEDLGAYSALQETKIETNVQKESSWLQASVHERIQSKKEEGLEKILT